MRRRGAAKKGWGGLSQLTVFDKLAQPALTGFGRVLHALARTRVYVFARVRPYTAWGRGRVDWRSEKGVVLGYTIQQTGEHIEYIQLEARAKRLTCGMCSLSALPRASAQTCANIYLNLYVREANTCVYIPVFVSAAPIPFRRAEEATSRRHGPHHFTSKQLVSQDFRSPYLQHQHAAAFHCEKLSPPSPR